MLSRQLPAILVCLVLTLNCSPGAAQPDDEMEACDTCSAPVQPQIPETTHLPRIPANALPGPISPESIAPAEIDPQPVTKCTGGGKAWVTKWKGRKRSRVRIKTPRVCTEIDITKNCSQFIDSTGALGEQGRDFATVIQQSPQREAFLKANSLGTLCPKYATLSEAQKLQASVWAFAVLAYEESTCNLNADHPKKVCLSRHRNGRCLKWQTINPLDGYGYVAFVEDDNNRMSRLVTCETPFRKLNCVEIRTYQEQIRCFADMVYKDTNCGKRPFTPNANSYWGPNRRAKTQLIPHMKRFKGCF